LRICESKILDFHDSLAPACRVPLFFSQLFARRIVQKIFESKKIQYSTLRAFPHQQRFFNDTQLKDERTLAECSMQREYTPSYNIATWSRSYRVCANEE
jgi:hypothetical protein